MSESIASIPEIETVPSEEEDQESVPPAYDISTYPADFTLEVLHTKWKSDEILIPRFQRAFVWKQTQSSRLIESFLSGLPVPAIFLYSERETRKYLVIDGQQRLRTVFSYFDGIFGDEKEGKKTVFRLTGLNERSKFYSLTYDELEEEDQRQLRNSVLRAFVVQQLNPSDDTSMYHIFERLNTGGTLLANQEIRNCVLHGPFTEFLQSMNQIDNWRRIYGKPTSDVRKRDVELILRFFALLHPSDYRKPMKDYLTRYMRRHRNDPVDSLDEMRRLFEHTCAAVVRVLGDKPFHVRSGLNAATFDAVMTAFARNRDVVGPDVHARYLELLGDKMFEDRTRSGTTDVDVVHQRLEQAVCRLFPEAAASQS